MTCNCIILAGGKSSRMEVDKALIHFNGDTLLNNLISSVQPLAKEVIIVSNNENHNIQGCKFIQEKNELVGPIGGILEGLKATSTEWNLVLSVDMPYLKIANLINQLPNDQGTNLILPIQENQIQYLAGFYHTRNSEIIQQQITDNKFSLKNLTNISLTKLIKTKELNFANLNDRNDLANAELMMFSLKTFGQVAEAIGSTDFNLISTSKAVLELKQELINNYPSLKNLTFQIAVNQDLVKEDFILSSYSEIALLPPFAGG